MNDNLTVKRECPKCGTIPTLEAENAAATTSECPYCDSVLEHPPFRGYEWDGARREWPRESEASNG